MQETAKELKELNNINNNPTSLGGADLRTDDARSASPDSEDIEWTEPEVLKRDYPSVEQIQDGCRNATGGGITTSNPLVVMLLALGGGV